MSLNSAYLLLGSNLGNSIAILNEVTRVLDEKAGKLITKSDIVVSESWGYISENKYYNQALHLQTKLSASGLLDLIMKIEDQTGRIRNTEQYADRVIDIDILFYNHNIISLENLTIPHPLLHLRRFVLFPLNQIAPGYVHPSLHKTVYELLENCIDPLKVELLHDTI